MITKERKKGTGKKQAEEIKGGSKESYTLIKQYLDTFMIILNRKNINAFFKAECVHKSEIKCVHFKMMFHNETHNYITIKHSLPIKNETLL